MKSDCRIWKEFLDQPSSVCRPFIDFTTVLTADELDFFTDASGSEKLGFGCVFNKEWTFTMWNPEFIRMCRPSIEYLELFAVTVAVLLWAKKLINRRVIIFCDNMSVVEMINKAVSSCRNCMVLVRMITLASTKANVRFFARYIKSAENVRADALSYGQMSSFWNYSRKDTSPVPTPIPGVLWLMEKLWIKPVNNR